MRLAAMRWWCCACLTTAAGCIAPRGSAPRDFLREWLGHPPPEATVDITGYLGPDGDRVYMRTTEPALGEDEAPYRQEVGRRRTEGRMCGVDLHPVGDYIAGQAIWPDDGTVFFFEFTPPLPEWPDAIGGSSPAEWAASVSCFKPQGESGQPFRVGTVTRSVRLLSASATVTVLGKRYDGCVVLGGVTTFDLGVTLLRVEEVVWLAPGVGVVRRQEAITGTLLSLLQVSASYQYSLVQLSAEKPRGGDRRFRRVALCLESKIPPKVGGAIVEWPDAEEP
jgi:hypothetical protein